MIFRLKRIGMHTERIHRAIPFRPPIPQKNKTGPDQRALPLVSSARFQYRWGMSRKFAWLATVVFWWACCAKSTFAAETNAVIPYKSLDELYQFIDDVDPAKLEVRAFISSTNKTVRTTDIRLTIQSTVKGMIPLPLGTNGQVLKFPHQKELRSENPPIVSNQPKGALSLMVSVELPLPDDLTFRYQRLGDGVAEVNKAIKAKAGMLLSLLAPKAQGVTIIFPKASAGKAKVEILGAADKTEFTADEKGRVKLKMDKALLAKNPEVRVSEKPEAIVPDIK